MKRLKHVPFMGRHCSLVHLDVRRWPHLFQRAIIGVLFGLPPCTTRNTLGASHGTHEAVPSTPNVKRQEHRFVYARSATTSRSTLKLALDVSLTMVFSTLNMRYHTISYWRNISFNIFVLNLWDYVLALVLGDCATHKMGLFISFATGSKR
jgi:hypothetical protein